MNNVDFNKNKRVKEGDILWEKQYSAIVTLHVHAVRWSLPCRLMLMVGKIQVLGAAPHAIPPLNKSGVLRRNM